MCFLGKFDLLHPLWAVEELFENLKINRKLWNFFNVSEEKEFKVKLTTDQT